MVGTATFGLWWTAADNHLSFLVGYRPSWGIAFTAPEYCGEHLQAAAGIEGIPGGVGDGGLNVGVEGVHKMVIMGLVMAVCRSGTVIAAHAAFLLRYPTPLHQTESFE